MKPFGKKHFRLKTKLAKSAIMINTKQLMAFLHLSSIRVFGGFRNPH